MDIKPEDMTLEIHLDNIRIGISNTQFALEKTQRELHNLQESYLVIKKFIGEIKCVNRTR